MSHPRHRLEKRDSKSRRIHGPSGLPQTLLDLLPDRLARLTLTYALVYALAVLTGEGVRRGFGAEIPAWHAGHMIALVFVLLALLAWRLVRSGRVPQKRLVGLGLVFMVVGSLGIGLATHSPEMYWYFVEQGAQPALLGVTWIAVWVLIYPLVVPSPPRHTLVAALVSANMGLAALGFWLLIGDLPSPPAEFLLALVIPNYICVMMSFMASHTLYSLGSDLGAAREMGSYRLERQLGAGGMGEVWLANHRLLARPAAIKLIRRDESEGLDGTAMKRFEMEAQATAALSSPHTVQLYDFGTSEDGTFYYVMELLEGLDLEALVERFGPVPAERAVHLLRGICLSLCEAHERGLIHRDIKPANIYACRLGLESDFIKVLDFGLVKTQNRSQDMTRLTVGAMAIGTPSFLAPEQATGAPVDGRTDLYALGCVAFWLLSGRLVFRGENQLQTLLKHVQETPPAPSQWSELEIPAELDELVLRCLEKDPGRRPASAREMLAALEAIPLRKIWNEQRANAWWDQHHPREEHSAATSLERAGGSA